LQVAIDARPQLVVPHELDQRAAERFSPPGRLETLRVRFVTDHERHVVAKNVCRVLMPG